MSKLVYARFALLRASPAGSEEGSLFCVLTARLKSCPDTCMVDGCGVVAQADVGSRFVTKEIKNRKFGA
ncbi:hypothetical protein AYO50_01850 [Acidobacteria bacterium SCGC AG-212-P17]|nr:hypothetical protein AYO50_01850 [Acidobacteria bacterium SCGC AG-212-P17]